MKTPNEIIILEIEKVQKQMDKAILESENADTPALGQIADEATMYYSAHLSVLNKILLAFENQQA